MKCGTNTPRRRFLSYDIHRINDSLKTGAFSAKRIKSLESFFSQIHLQFHRRFLQKHVVFKLKQVWFLSHFVPVLTVFVVCLGGSVCWSSWFLLDQNIMSLIVVGRTEKFPSRPLNPTKVLDEAESRCNSGGSSGGTTGTTRSTGSTIRVRTWGRICKKQFLLNRSERMNEASGPRVWCVHGPFSSVSTLKDLRT